jgi:hypothetical protein
MYHYFDLDALPPREAPRYPLYRKLGNLHGSSGRVQKFLNPCSTSMIETQNAQPVATGRSDYATPTANERYRQQNESHIFQHKHERCIYRLVYRVRDPICCRVAFMCSNLNDRSRYTHFQTQELPQLRYEFRGGFRHTLVCSGQFKHAFITSRKLSM